MPDWLPFTDFAGESCAGLPFALVIGVATLVNGLGVLAALCGLPPGRPVGLGAVVRAAIAAALLLTVEVGVLRPRGLSVWGVMSLVWYLLALVLPAAALFVLWRGRRPGAVLPAVRVIAAGALLAAPIAAWMRFGEPYRLVVEEVHAAIPAARSGEADLRIVVLSDLQTDRIGAFERRVAERANALAPDLVLLPGDLFQGRGDRYAAERGRLRDWLASLRAPGGVFVVAGDTDVYDDLPELCADAGVTLLRNEVARVRVQDRDVSIAGVLPDFVQRHVRAWTPGRAIAALEQDLRHGPPGDVRLLLAHRGEEARAFPPATHLDLVVAGHTHGGQVQLPWLGPPLTLSGLPRHVAAGGLFEIDGRALYQSRGIGMERFEAPRIRLLCPPTIGLVVLGDTRGGTDDP